MRTLILTSLLILTPLAALSEEAVDKREAFYGIWGTKKQCAREPFKKGGTVRAAPYVITPQWVKQGNLWCSLNWGPVENSPTGKQSAANAHCGEDSVRSYFLGFKLKDEKLTLRWDFLRANGPLEQCVAG
ncbi:MAG: hypothetical protein ABJN04_05615 [Hyphomicrobiales bacterium]